MKRLIFVSLALAALSFFSACGKKEEFKYSLTYNGCATGEHEADSKEELCTMLKNDQLNNFCAKNLRKEKYEADGCGNW